MDIRSSNDEHHYDRRERDDEDRVSIEYFHENTNVRLAHIKRKNVDVVDLDKHLSDLEYSGNFILITDFCRSIF